MEITKYCVFVFLYIFFSCEPKGKINSKEEQHIEEQTPIADFYSISDSNQLNPIFAPDFNKIWFENLDKKFTWDKFDPYNNKYWEYMTGLFDTLPKIAKDQYKSDRDFFNKLTRGQKILYTFSVFGGEVDNGGVNQFFFNDPEFCFAALESFKELELDTLSKDYEKCLIEFLDSTSNYHQRKNNFNNEQIDWQKRWKSFKDGESDIKSARHLEDYFYEDEFKKKIYISIVNYIENHLEQFVKNDK